MPLKRRLKKRSVGCLRLSYGGLLKAAVANDADEISITASSFDARLEVCKWQAIVKFRNKQRVWAVVVHEDPEYAMHQALFDAANLPNLEETPNEAGTQNKSPVLRRSSKRGGLRAKGVKRKKA